VPTTFVPMLKYFLVEIEIIEDTLNISTGVVFSDIFKT
jgi:hypothetical protein